VLDAIAGVDAIVESVVVPMLGPAGVALLLVSAWLLASVDGSGESGAGGL
jgi:hypothetical protein